MNPSLPKVRLVVYEAVDLVEVRVRPTVGFSGRQFYKYNRELEHDQYRKRSTGTTTRLRNETYLFKGNIHSLCSLEETILV